MDLEQVKTGVDVADQAGPTRREEHGADATCAEPLDAIAQFVVDIAPGRHGHLGFPLRRINQSFLNSPLPFLEESPLACLAFFSDGSTHSKACLFWNSEDVFVLLLFQKPRGLSRPLPFFTSTNDKSRLFWA
jgi:hypothetical protein